LGPCWSLHVYTALRHTCTAARAAETWRPAICTLQLTPSEWCCSRSLEGGGRSTDLKCKKLEQNFGGEHQLGTWRTAHGAPPSLVRSRSELPGAQPGTPLGSLWVKCMSASRHRHRHKLRGLHLSYHQPKLVPSFLLRSCDYFGYNLFLSYADANYRPVHFSVGTSCLQLSY
jgi:hypothetical protein